MKISDNGLKLIESFEGLFLKAYQCQAKRWTIGYGTIKYPNGEKVKKGDVCTPEQANNWLRFEVIEKCGELDRVIAKYNVSFTQNQFDAVSSFIYNTGAGVLKSDRSFGSALIAKDQKGMADSLLLYCKYRNLFGMKVTSRGLLNRRKAERELFLRQD